jgi:hypothetical protein
MKRNVKWMRGTILLGVGVPICLLALAFMPDRPLQADPPVQAGLNSYELVPMDPIPGVQFASIAGISNSAVLFGDAFDEFFENQYGAIRKGNQTTLFPSTSLVQPPPANPWEVYAWAYGINNLGTSVGTAESGNFPNFAYTGWIRSNNGNVQVISEPGADVWLYGINDLGVTVGESDESGFWRPYVVDSAGQRSVNVPGLNPATGTSAWFADINNNGSIVGGTYNTQAGFGAPFLASIQPFLLDGSVRTDFTYPGATVTYPAAINNLGQVAGWWSEHPEPFPYGNDPVHGFIREANGTFRTVEIDYPWEEISIGSSWEFFAKATTIIDMNDKGELVVNVIGIYRFIGTQFTTPVWFEAVAKPVHG